MTFRSSIHQLDGERRPHTHSHWLTTRRTCGQGRHCILFVRSGSHRRGLPERCRQAEPRKNRSRMTTEQADRRTATTSTRPKHPPRLPATPPPDTRLSRASPCPRASAPRSSRDGHRAGADDGRRRERRHRPSGHRGRRCPRQPARRRQRHPLREPLDVPAWCPHFATGRRLGRRANQPR